MSIQTELTRITNAKAAIKTAIEGKGVTVPAGTLLDGMAPLIASIQAGGSNKLYCETVTFEADKTTYEINHDLGERPNFLLYFTLSTNSSLSTYRTPAALLFVSNGIMYYASVGTGNSSYNKKGFAKTDMITYSDKSYVNIEPITGLSLVVPSEVGENYLTLKGSSFYMPAGTYFMMCGVIEF